MRLLGTAALAAAAIVTSVVAVPAGAATPGWSATTGGDCAGGTITLHQEQVSEGATHVVITGDGVPNGRWKGGYDPEVDDGVDDETELSVNVTDHTFEIELDVDGAADRFPTAYLLQRKARVVCSMGYYSQGTTFAVVNYDMTTETRFVDTGVVAASGIVFGCTNGSTWRWTVRAEYAEGEATRTVKGRACHHGTVKLPKTVVSGEGLGSERPNAVRVVARGSDGQVRTSSWLVPSPVG